MGRVVLAPISWARGPRPTAPSRPSQGPPSSSGRSGRGSRPRDTPRPNVAVANRVVGEVAGKECVLVDDMIDTAGTITEAIKVLNNAGAKKVIVVATHGILSDPAARRLSESGAAEVVVTDTLPIAPEKRFEQLTVLSIAPLLARAIREVFEDGSVTSLFN